MKNWLGFLICLVLSSGMWLALYLSQPYTQLVSVPVAISSNIDGHASRSYEDVMILARCRASGYRHLSLQNRIKPAGVFIDGDDFLPGGSDGIYELPTSVLNKYVAEIFGEDVTVESFITESVFVHFASENFAMVPVRPAFNILYRAQYAASSPVKMSPDTIVIYGSPDIIDNIDYISTKPVALKDVHKMVHGTVELNAPAGVRLSQNSVDYSIDVTRFVEIRSSYSIGVVNVPAGSELKVYPSKVDVLYICPFPVFGNPTDNVEFYVDYNEFASSITGKCMIRERGLSDDVIRYTLSPEVCECVEIRN